MKKRLLAILLVIAFVCSFASCQTDNANCQHSWNENPVCQHSWNENPVNDAVRCTNCNTLYSEKCETAYKSITLKLNNANFYNYFDLIVEKQISGIPSVELKLKNPERYVGWQVDSFSIEVRGRSQIYHFSDVLGMRIYGLSEAKTLNDGSAEYHKYPFDTSVFLKQERYTFPGQYDKSQEGDVLSISMTVRLLYSREYDTAVVNANEWKFALELYHFKNYTFSVDEQWEDDPEDKGRIISTIKSNQGIIYGTQTETNNGVTEVETIHRYHQFDYLSDFNAGWISEFGNEIEDMTDWGYSKFSYSDETHSYSATMEIDGIPTKVTVKFDKGFLVKITLDGQGKYDESDAYECKFTGTYEFFDYNTTEDLPTPQE